MNYPIWDIPILGNGLVVAIIAIIHVLISHLAIGGGAFLFVAELWSNRQPNGEQIRNWLRGYTKFFLVYTTVFGAVTGVGIWFAIQLANAEATSLLIHQYVFAWAIEWVMFLGELTTLYLYYYGWEKNTRTMQVFLAGAYFIIAWLSLVVINGILTFMLTPGAWSLHNPDILAGFFNPGYFPALIIRTLVMFLLGGLFGIIVASKVKDDEFKERIILFCSKWVIPAAVIIPLATLWFWTTIPQNTLEFIKAGISGLGGGRLDIITRYFWLAVVSGVLIILGTVFILFRPRATTFTGAVALFAIAQFGFLGGEFFREMARKPYVIYDVLYSNGLWKNRSDDLQYMNKSYFENTRWEKPLIEPLSHEHGEWIFRLQCASCHTRDGYRSLSSRVANWTPEFGYKWFLSMHEQGVMPPFQGDEIDRAALVAYLMTLKGEDFNAIDLFPHEMIGDTTPPDTAAIITGEEEEAR